MKAKNGWTVRSFASQFGDWLVFLCLLSAVAAGVQGNFRGTVAFGAAAVVNGVLAWRHERVVSSLALRAKALLLPRHLFPSERSIDSSLRRQVKETSVKMALLVVVFELFLLGVGWGVGITPATGLAFGLAIVAALLPVGLMYELLIVTDHAHPTKAAAITAKVIRCAMSDNLAELLLVLVSLLGLLAWHIPLAATAVEIVALNAVLLAAPLAAVAWDSRPPHPRVHADAGKLLTFGLAAAGLAYTNFLLFFARTGLSPRYVDMQNPYYFKATSVALLTLLLCQVLNLLVVRADEHDRFFSDYLKSNRRLLWALGFSLFLVLNLLYNPPVRWLLHTGSLGLMDWLAAIAAAALYLGVRLLQRHTRRHSRRAVLELHHQRRLAPPIK